MPGRRADAAFYGACAAAAALCAALLFPYLGDRMMHRDEALALMVARRPVGELLATVQLVRGGAPLHFLLSSAVAALGGGLAATRALSAAFLVIAVIATGLLGRALFGRLEGVAAAVGVALSPVALFYGQFARMYGLFLALSTLALWCLVRALDGAGARYWAGVAVFLVLDVYAHPYGVVVGVIAGGTALASVVRRRRPGALRLPLRTGAAVLVGTAPLAAGYLVLASRLGDVRTPPSRPLAQPPAGDVLYQAFANFLGVPRPGRLLTLVALYLIAAALLLLAGLAATLRHDAERAVLFVLWLGLPALTLAIVRTPGTDNHVRYVIEVLPAVLLLIAHGALRAVRRAGPAPALAVALALVVTLGGVELGRGRALADYRYRGTSTPAERAEAGADAAYLRARFAPHDLFLGYDPAFAYGVVAPGENRALGAARGVARSEGPLVVRSLDRVHGPIAHGWYVALARRGSSYARFRRALGPGFETRRFGRWVLVRTRAAPLTPRRFATAGLRVFRTAETVLRDPNAPTTAQALDDALPELG